VITVAKDVVLFFFIECCPFSQILTNGLFITLWGFSFFSGWGVICVCANKGHFLRANEHQAIEKFLSVTRFT